MQAARAVWCKRLSWLLAHPGKIGDIVFIDKTGINTKMARLRGCCLKGQWMGRQHPSWPLEEHDLNCHHIRYQSDFWVIKR